jgi:uncharacterized membrane protein
MVAPQNSQNVAVQNSQVAPPRASKRIAGVALMLLGVALMAYGTHYLAMNGTCSSTGYVSYGPVPKCHGNEFLYITSAFFLGPAVIFVGWAMAGVSGVLWPVFCLGMAASMITIRNETTVSAGAKAFALLMGEIFVLLALVSVIVTVRKRLKRKHAPVSSASSVAELTGPTEPAGLSTGLVTSPPVAHQAAAPGARTASGPEPDPLDTIAKLARLRDSGAITKEEYEQQKTKLLSEM